MAGNSKELVRLRAENERLRAENKELRHRDLIRAEQLYELTKDSEYQLLQIGAIDDELEKRLAKNGTN